MRAGVAARHKGVDGEGRLGVQRAPHHVPPDWPDGTPEQQIVEGDGHG